MSIDPREINDDDEEVLVARFAADLDAIADADQAISRMPEPRVPSGGRVEQWAKPALSKTRSVRDTARVWSPALAATVVFLVLLLSPAPKTGPLIVYALGWLGYGLWVSAGRPGPRDSAVLIGRTAATVGRWIAAAAIWVFNQTRRATRAVTRTGSRSAKTRPAPAN